MGWRLRRTAPTLPPRRACAGLVPLDPPSPPPPVARGEKDLGPGEPADPSVGGGQHQRGVGHRLDGEVDTARLDARPRRRGHALAAELLGDVEALRTVATVRRGAARSPRASRAPGSRMSAPWIRVPSSSRPANQHHPKAHQSRTPQEWSRCPWPDTASTLVAHRHGAAHQAGDLVAGGDGVLVRHPVGRPRQVEAEGGGRALLAPVDTLGTTEHLGRRRAVQAQPVERASTSPSTV